MCRCNNRITISCLYFRIWTGNANHNVAPDACALPSGGKKQNRNAGLLFLSARQSATQQIGTKQMEDNRMSGNQTKHPFYFQKSRKKCSSWRDQTLPTHQIHE